MTNKKLLREISKWKEEELISSETESILIKRYSSDGRNTLITIFSVLGSALIGTGIILLFATNWVNIPMSIKTVVSFLPLVLGQGIGVFTLFKKYDSTVFRECAAIFYTAGIYATVAIISFGFHLGTKGAVYSLICAVMTLPVMFVLDAVSPLLVYYCSVIYWGIDTMETTDSVVRFLCSVALIVLGMLFCFLIGRKSSFSQGRYSYSLWLSVTASFYVTVGISDSIDGFMPLIFAFFVLIYSVSRHNDEYSKPFRTIGSIGIIVMTVIYSLGKSWGVGDDIIAALLGGIITAVIILFAVVFSVIRQRRDIFKLIFTLGASASVLLAVISHFFEDADMTAFTVIINIVLIAICVGFIIRGAVRTEMITTNIGLITAITVIFIRLIDDSFSIVLKGIVFILMGLVLLIVNMRLLKKKKSVSVYKEVPEG